MPLLRFAYYDRENGLHFVEIAGDRRERRNIYSITKTFTSFAIGLLEAEGKLKLEDKVYEYFPEFADLTSAEHREIRIIDLLQMRSGKKVPLFRKHKTDTKEDWARIFFSEPLQVKAGTEFYYCNLNSYMLGRLVLKSSGERLSDFLYQRLFAKLGIDKPEWGLCYHGYELAYTKLHLNLEELAKVARLMLDAGFYEAQEIVPAAYLDRMHEDLVPSELYPELETRNGYGYQVWKSCHANAWRADGLYGQFILIYPEEEKYLVAQAADGKEHDPYDFIALVDDILI
ncbi:MAG: serine hydrolase [Eubacteriales bacterium]|nr:serine hydrolase [Eubacteriales bacterium]